MIRYIQSRAAGLSRGSKPIIRLEHYRSFFQFLMSSFRLSFGLWSYAFSNKLNKKSTLEFLLFRVCEVYQYNQSPFSNENLKFVLDVIFQKVKLIINNSSYLDESKDVACVVLLYVRKQGRTAEQAVYQISIFWPSLRHP